MSTLLAELQVPNAQQVSVISDTLRMDLSDGRSVSVPLAWFPRLLHATPEEHKNWRLLGGGQGVHWEELDDDISVEGMLVGRSSGEARSSFRRWLEKRTSSAT
jgi:hypothetical protein